MLALLGTTTLIAGVSACSSSGTDSGDSGGAGLTSVSVRTDFTIGGKDLPYFEALANGYYKKHGLNVTVNAGAGSASTMQLVSNGKVDFGQAAAPAFVQEKASGLDLTMVASFMNRSVYNVFSYCSANITKPADLQGKTVAIASGDASYTATLQIMLKQNNVPTDSVKTVSITPSAVAQVVAQKRAKAGLGTVTGSGLAFNLAASKGSKGKTCSMQMSNFGVEGLGYGLATTKEFAKSKPAVVKSFIAATAEGWAAALKDPKPGLGLMKKQFPSGDPAYWEQGFAIAKGYIHSDETTNNSIGFIAAKDLQATIDLVQSYKKLPSTSPAYYYDSTAVPK